LNKFDEVEDGANTEWALPLLDTQKSLGDLIQDFDKQSQVEIKSDGSIIMHYKGSYVARSSLDIFSAFRNAFFPLTDTVMKVPLNTPSGVFVDYADVKTGTLSWGFLLNEELDITLKIPQLEKNGVPFFKKFKASGTYIDSVDLSGWRLVANNDLNIVVTHDARRPNGERVNLANLGIVSIKNFEFNF
jgi:hypothetical protein